MAVWTQAGVKVGPYTVSSYAMPGQPDTSSHRFSLFPYSWDLPADTQPVVYARNAAGDKCTATFWTKIFPKKFHVSTIPLTDHLMQKILNDIDPDGKIPGDLLARYLYCNREMRKQNSKQLFEMRLNTVHRVPMEWSVRQAADQNRIIFRRPPQLHVSRQEGG